MQWKKRRGFAILDIRRRAAPGGYFRKIFKRVILIEYSQLFYFAAASVLLTLAPGPDILYLIAKSLSDGVKSGVVLALGLCSGLFFHTALVAFGVSEAISRSEVLFHLLRYAGAAYLIFLALSSVRACGRLSLEGKTKRETLARLYVRGIAMNILNPKVVLFFLAFLPQFVPPRSPHIKLDILILGCVFAAQAFAVFAAVAALSGVIRSKAQAVGKLSRQLAWLQAAVLFGIAAGLLVFE